MVVEDAFATPGDSARLAPGAPGISQAAHGRRPRRAPRRAARAAASSRSDLLVALLANPESGRGEAREAERLLQEHGAELRRFTLARGSRWRSFRSGRRTTSLDPSVSRSTPGRPAGWRSPAPRPNYWSSPGSGRARSSMWRAPDSRRSRRARLAA